MPTHEIHHAVFRVFRGLKNTSDKSISKLGLMLGNRNRAAEANVDVRAWVGWAVAILPAVNDLAVV